MGWKQLEHERFLMSLSQLYSTACQHSQMCINDGCGMWRKSCDSSRPSSSTSSEDEMWTKDNVLLKKMQGVDPKLYFWLLLYSQMEKAVASWFDEVKVQTSIEAHHLHSIGSFSWSKGGRNHHRDPGPVAPPCPNSNFQHQKATPSASPKERN